MPHLTLEYTANLSGLDATPLLADLNAAMAASGLFDEADIKSRAIRLDAFCIGTDPSPRAFVHLKVSLMPGRPPAVRQELSQRLLATLSPRVVAPQGTALQLCVELFEIDRDSYAKASRT